MGLRVDGRHFSLKGREYVRGVIRDYSPEIVIPKAAQMAFTVTMVTKSLHYVIVRRVNGLYLLPLKAGSVGFVQSRIDPIIDSNPQLAAQFSSVDNRLQKQSISKNNLYIRGTNISTELQEVPVDFEMWDEYDRMVMDNMPDAKHRMDGSEWKRLVKLSTPTVEGHGVYSDDEWPRSDQHRWEIPCPGCGRFQSLNWNDKELDYNNLRMGDAAEECALECAWCKREFKDRERRELNAKGRWSAMNLGGRIRGYYINQFNSPTQSLEEIMNDYFSGLTEARKMKAFWQQNMGKPYAAKGDRFNEQLLDSCRVKGYFGGGIPPAPLAVGIDIGTHIHLWAWTFQGNMRLLWAEKLFTGLEMWSDLAKYLDKLGSWRGVIDAHPEKSKARELALKFHGHLWLGFEQDRDQQAEIANFDKVKRGEAPEVKIDRTLAFDENIHNFIDGKVGLPIDARERGEFMPMKDYNGVYHHFMQMVRIEQEKPSGGIVARWAKNKNPDHWHHACMFADIATLMRPQLKVPAGLAAALNRSVIGG
jgi:hypothetical protein